MKQKILFFPIVLLILASCGKSKFQTVPQIKIKSLTPDVVVKGNIITLKARVTDNDGDLQDSLLITYNRFNNGSLLTSDTLRTSLAPLDFPDSRDIEVQVQFIYGQLTPPYYFLNSESTDTNVSFGLIVQDRAGHRSDYVESKQILLKKP